MSRDKYAQNHKITLNEGSGTLTIDGNLDVESNLEVVGNADIGGNLNITGDLTLAGQFDVPHLDLETAVPQVYRIMGAGFSPVDSTSGSHITYGYTGANFGRVTDTAGNHSTYLIAIAPSLPHGAKITGFSFTGDVSLVGNAVTIRFYDTNGLTSTLIDTLAMSNLGGRTTVTSTLGSVYTVNYHNNGRSIFIAVTIARANNAGPVYIDYVDIAYTLKTFPQSYLVNPT